VQSHHPVQDAWARRYADANGLTYRRDAAPGVLLRSEPGQPHYNITSMQDARRGRPNGWDTTPREEVRISYDEMLRAGVPESVARRAIGRSFAYLDSMEFFE
jgi:hypothetical protein